MEVNDLFIKFFQFKRFEHYGVVYSKLIIIDEDILKIHNSNYSRFSYKIDKDEYTSVFSYCVYDILNDICIDEFEDLVEIKKYINTVIGNKLFYMINDDIKRLTIVDSELGSVKRDVKLDLEPFDPSNDKIIGLLSNNNTYTNTEAQLANNFIKFFEENKKNFLTEREIDIVDKLKYHIKDNLEISNTHIEDTGYKHPNSISKVMSTIYDKATEAYMEHMKFDIYVQNDDLLITLDDYFIKVNSGCSDKELVRFIVENDILTQIYYNKLDSKEKQKLVNTYNSDSECYVSKKTLYKLNELFSKEYTIKKERIHDFTKEKRKLNIHKENIGKEVSKGRKIVYVKNTAILKAYND